MNNGTPKTLKEAIRNGLCIGKLTLLEDSLNDHVKDFLAQRFGVAYLQASGDELERLEKLYKSIVGE